MKTKNRRVSTPLGTFIKCMSILMVIVYVAMGLLVLAGGGSLINVPDHYVLPIGTALLGYGIFRSYRIYVLYFKNS